MSTSLKNKFPQSSDDEKRDYRQELTDKVIAMLEQSAQYQKPWIPSSVRPYNPSTGTVYKGVNAIALMTAGFNDPRFYTFMNILALDKAAKADDPNNPGVKLKKGAKGVPIFKARQIIIPNEDEEAELTGENDENKGQTFMVMAYAGTVFNAEQIDGIPKLEREHAIKEFDPHEKAEFFIEAMKKETGLKWSHDIGNRAGYYLADDCVRLPGKERFKSSGLYYRTALHELGHATGHPDRLNRKFGKKFGDNAHAFEELVAEISSFFTGYETGVPYSPDAHENHAAYLQSWIKVLKNDKNAIFKACSAASKAADYQLDIATKYHRNLATELGYDPHPEFGFNQDLNLPPVNPDYAHEETMAM